jgi:dolichol-phosphate mannosyltransferase
MATSAIQTTPELAVVVPVFNEQDNVAPLVEEISAALDDVFDYEIVYVDDGSRDSTLDNLRSLAAKRPRLRVLRHRTCCGQSAAIATGVKAARAAVIATLDGDGQNDPADIPKLFEVLKESKTKDFLLVAGLRKKRRDSWVKRMSSRIANGVRSRILGDDTKDTGCGLKVFMRTAFLDMPRFDHMHRFLAALMIRRGGKIISVAVNHRPRQQGQSKYGTLGRLRVGIVDLFGVLWLKARATAPEVEEITNAPENGSPDKTQ